MSKAIPPVPKPRGFHVDRHRSGIRTYTGLSAMSGYLISFVTHLLLFIGLAIGVTRGIPSDKLVVTVSNSQFLSDDDLDLTSDFSVQPTPLVTDEPVPSIVEPEFAVAPKMEVELPDLEQQIGTSGNVKGELAKATARDGSNRKGLSGMGGGSSFFGIESAGEKFVFIVDSSRSMQGKRWEHANKELLRSISELGPDQKFFVICFDYVARPAFDLLPENIKFLTASNNSRRRIRQWIQSLDLGSNTRPADAMRLALALRPDAIYLLSDGELEDDTYEMLALANHDASTGKVIVPIHTISLYSTSGRELLELIASNNGGKFVNVDK
jgi:uncharacterized protein YegL